VTPGPADHLVLSRRHDKCGRSARNLYGQFRRLVRQRDR
jgi:hypothetical protein